MNHQPERHLCVPEPAVRARFDCVRIAGARRIWTSFRRNFAPALALILAAPLAAAAQGTAASAVRPRVTDRVDTSRLTTLKGNTHPLARAQYDQGAAPATLPMNRIMLLLQRSPEQEAALQDLLVQQQVSTSPNFHKWVTPDQFGQQFGPADADVQAVTSWLASFGFQNIKVSRGRVTIEFSGTASQVETALHTPIHRYVVNGESHWANANDPQIPSALAPVVTGFASLHNFRPHPTIRSTGQKFPAKVRPGANPQIDLGSNGTTHALVPADFNKIYNVGSGMTGAGVTIGIISDTNINLQDINDFRSMFGAPNNPPTIVLNGPDPGDLLGTPEGEAVLDTTWAASVAPAATVDLVVTADTDASAGTDLSEIYIVDNNSADVMTESFSTCELQLANAGLLTGTNGAAAFYGGLAEQAAAQGITYLVSSGDGGPDTCDDQSTIPTTDFPASVNLLAATPFNVAVGGTEFHDCDPLPGCVDSAHTYWQATNGTNSESAKSYIPESVWNESCTVLSSSCSAIGLWSSGGGQSIAFAKPAWQAGVTGIPTANARFLPDVSLNAADHDGYVLCIDGSCHGTGCPTGVTVCFGIASGTSASVQAFGGIMALVDQNIVGHRVGNANYVFYKLAASQTYSSCNGSTVPSPGSLASCVFNDVTVGNTNIPGETGFTAGTAYDEATGLGSVNVANLVNQWHTAQSASTTTTLNLNSGTAVNITHGQSILVAVTVSPTPPATGAPSGDVSLVAASSGTGQGADFFPLTQNGTSSSASWGTNFLPGGTNYSVRARYPGDGKFLGSDSAAVNVTVNPEASVTLAGIINESASAGFCTTETSFVYGSPYILTIGVVDARAALANATGPVCQPTPSGAFPSGNVSVTVDGAPLGGGAGLFPLNSNGYLEYPAIQLTAGNHTILANYQGDNSFKAGTSPTSLALIVAKDMTTTAVAANPTNPNVGGSVTLTATVATTSNATANASQEPTGTIQFFVGNTTLVGSAAAAGSVAVSGFAQATASIQTTTLPQGNDSITAKYSGDTNYTASTSSGVTVNVGSAGINISSGCTSATIPISAAGQSGSCLITVSGGNGFAGTVALSAAVTGGPSGAVYAPACNSFGTPDQSFTAPNTITLSSTTTSGNATMTCSTRAASGVMVRPSSRPSGRGWPFAGVAIALAGLLFLVTARRERRWALVPLAGLLAVVVLAGVSCNGSGYKAPGSSPGTTAGTYTITVTATPNSGTAQTTTVSVVVP